MSFSIKTDKKAFILFLSAFLIPALAVALVFAGGGVYPFGDRTILHIDMYHQYAPFFTEFQNKLKSGGSLMYSWNLGVGSDFIATYAYYLASPMNWLLLFVSRDSVIEFMTFLVIVKTGLSGLSFAAYAKGHFDAKPLVALIPAVLYALSGFFSAYYWDIMWLDSVFLLPLIVLGMERLIRLRRSGLYAVTLALSIWANYYISIMIVIFLVLWYFLTVSELTRSFSEAIKSFGRIVTVSVLSAGISAVLILPEIAILRISGSGSNTFPEEITWYEKAVNEAAQHLSLMPVTTTEGSLPNIFCGAAALFFVALYFMNRRIPLAQKIKRAALAAFFLISFNLNILDFIWHGLHFPEGLPARQSFLYSFLLLIMGLEALVKMEGNRLTDLIVAGALNGLLFVWIYVSGEAEERKLALAVTALFLICEVGLYLLARGEHKTLQKTAGILALMTVVIDGTLNFAETGLSTTDRNAYVEKLPVYRELVAAQRTGENDFFRTEKYERLMKDENCLSGYPAATLFSSLINYDVALAYKSAGLEGGRNFYCYNGATPLFSAMLSVRYLLTDNGEEESSYRRLIAEQDGTSLYENTYVLPLGFLAPNGLENAWNREDQQNRVAVVNALGKSLGASSDTMVYAGTMSEDEGDGVFTAPTDGYYFAVHQVTGAQSMQVTVGERVTTLSKTTHNYFLDLGYLTAGQEARVHPSNDKPMEASVYRVEQSAVEESFAALNEHTLSLEGFSDTKVTGQIDAPEGGDLVLSIPAEPGWSAAVDGQSVEPERFMDAFIKIPLTPGTHQISLTYRTPGIVVGGVVSLLCLGLLVVVLLVERKKESGRGQ